VTYQRDASQTVIDLCTLSEVLSCLVVIVYFRKLSWSQSSETKRSNLCVLVGCCFILSWNSSFQGKEVCSYLSRMMYSRASFCYAWIDTLGRGGCVHAEKLNLVRFQEKMSKRNPSFTQFKPIIYGNSIIKILTVSKGKNWKIEILLFFPSIREVLTNVIIALTSDDWMSLDYPIRGARGERMF